MFLKGTALTVFFSCWFSILLSQEKQDLQTLINRTSDTTGINALMDYGVELINVDNQKAKQVFSISLEKSIKLEYDYGIVSSYARLGYLAGHEGKNREGIQYAQKAVVHFERINRIRGIILCYINIGYNFDMLGMGDSSLHYVFKGI